MAQSQNTKIIDALSGDGIPIAEISYDNGSVLKHTDLKGIVSLDLGKQIEVNHPLFQSKSVMVEHADSLLIIILQPLESLEPTEQQLADGISVMESYHKHLPITSSTYQKNSFDFLSITEIDVFERHRSNHGNWSLLKSLESITENRYKYPDKKYSRVITSHYTDGDSSDIQYFPIHTYSVSERNEYISALDINYNNPLYINATKQYNFALLNTTNIGGDTMNVVYVYPKAQHNFLGLKGLLYFTDNTHENRGGYLLPNNPKIQEFTIAYSQTPTKLKTVFIKDFLIVLSLKNVPNYNKNSKVIFYSQNTPPRFDTQNTTSEKLVDLALLDNIKDSTNDDTWLMTQINSEQIEYIKKDTSENKFVLSETVSKMFKLYEGRIGYRTKYFNINNLLAFNKYEAVRIGIGLQSHESLSDVLSFGGYIGFGIKDAKFKYGGNIGAYFGPRRSNLISLKYINDLLEPGVVHYLDKKQDIVRNFFTSRMDSYQSTQLVLRSEINAFLTMQAFLNDYSLTPLYDYTYLPQERDPTETQKFNFTETSILLNLGTPFLEHANLRNILYGNKRIKSNLFINITKGWDNLLSGNYDYWKLNAMIKSTFKMPHDTKLNTVLDAGVMTTDQPYQIMYGGPGTEFKLTGIIIHNAFQTMKLYGFFTDRYINSFSNYNFGNVIFKKSKFKPELSLALNVGWGKLNSNPENYEGIDVRDYHSGYYEAGVIIDNLLRLKFYKYFYGGLGVGTFVGFGPDAENGAFAIRISYDIGVL